MGLLWSFGHFGAW